MHDTVPRDEANNVARTGLPTRIIVYAWGEKYLNYLLSFTLPGLLAPGNLPFVAANVPCEIVVLTEERFPMLAVPLWWGGSERYVPFIS
jgi:hypothetical protein